MTLRSEIAPNEAVYNENSEKVLEKRGSIRDTSSLSVESTVVDRASAVAKVMLEALRESADLVITADELDQFEVKARRATKYFKRALKATERAIARGFDDNAVITALVENLRVIANLIEVKRLNVAVAKDSTANVFGTQFADDVQLQIVLDGANLSKIVLKSTGGVITYNYGN